MGEYVSVPDIRDAHGLAGKRVLLLSPLNVPIVEDRVVNDFRLRKALDTILFLKNAGARVIVIGHIGRDPKNSLRTVAVHLKGMTELTFIPDLLGEEAKQAVQNLKDGECIMLENVRSHPGNVTNDEAFARVLAGMADIYVNDAFSASHREHAVVVSVPRFLPHYAGILFVEEVSRLKEAMQPEHPALLIIGGAKFETKRPIINANLDVYDHIFVGGAIANDFFKAKGLEVGKSLVSDNPEGVSDILGHKKIILPEDVAVAGPEGIQEKKIADITSEETILDAGPRTIEELKKRIVKMKYILWNGPLGNYEKGFREHTEEVARTIAGSGASSVVGGGDTIASIAALSLENKFAFLSTGGGAMLDFLAHGTLPGIQALKKRNV